MNTSFIALSLIGSLKGFLFRNWFGTCVVMLLLYLVLTREISVSIDVQGRQAPGWSGLLSGNAHGEFSDQTPLQTPLALGGEASGKTATKATEQKIKKRSSDYGNLDFILQPELAHREHVPAAIVEQKYLVCQEYVEQYEELAKQSARLHGIPASITLAQALLESNAGMSKLAEESSNHFGIKCRRKCIGCTCRNYSDDDRYDMFRVFEAAQESYKAHAMLLNGPRYQHLKKHGTDYKAWARGLSKAGYATDRNYAVKLVRIIETLRLHQYDE